MKITIPLDIGGSKITLDRESAKMARLVVVNSMTTTDVALTAQTLADLITGLEAMKLTAN